VAGRRLLALSPGGFMKIGILGWDHGEIDLETPPLAAAGRARGHETTVFTLEEIEYAAASRGGFDLMFGGHPARSFDAVISRAKLYGDDWQDRVERLTLASRVPGIKLFDPVEVWVTGYSKFQTIQRLAQAGLPVSPTRSVTTLSQIGEACQDWGTVIIKPSFAYGGTGVERITDLAADAAAAQVLLDRYGTMACMPYYPTEYGEYRLVVGGDTSCVATFKLPPVGVWKCKTLEGATFERVTPSPELADLAFRATRAMGMTLSGVDALPTADGYVILEVNPVPALLDMFGESFRQETYRGLYEWVEREAAG
jgi:ribosomal protein S6--L-glutamate ligase